MQYLFLAYRDVSQWEILSARERYAFDKACLAIYEALRDSGYLLGTVRLQNYSTATTVRVQNGKLSLTDSPFTETKEQLVGLFFINARDLNEAVRLASKMPQARHGPIQVVPMVEVRV